MTYSVQSAPADLEESSTAPMQTIPETHESSFPSAQQTTPPVTLTAMQHQQPISDPETGQRSNQQAPGKQLTSSNSMDSLLTLSDVDFGMEEQTQGVDEVDGPPPETLGWVERKRKVRSYVRTYRGHYGNHNCIDL